MISPVTPAAWFFWYVDHISCSRRCCTPASIVSRRSDPSSGSRSSVAESAIRRPMTSSWAVTVPGVPARSAFSSPSTPYWPFPLTSTKPMSWAAIVVDAAFQPDPRLVATEPAAKLVLWHVEDGGEDRRGEARIGDGRRRREDRLQL